MILYNWVVIPFWSWEEVSVASTYFAIIFDLTKDRVFLTLIIKQPFLCSWILWMSSDRTWQEWLISALWCLRPQVEDPDSVRDVLVSWAFSPWVVVTCLLHGWVWLSAEPHSEKFLAHVSTSSSGLVFLTTWLSQCNQTSYIVAQDSEGESPSLAGRSCTAFCNQRPEGTWH